MHQQNKNNEERESASKFGETTVARHFVEMQHSINELRWVILEQIYGQDKESVKIRLLRREIHWIVELETMAPEGLNEACHFSAFL